jgi:plastocyanin
MARTTANIEVALMLGTMLAFVPISGPGEPGSVETGSIQGEVALNMRPPRRSASRYPGGASGVHAIQPIPAIAYLEGAVSGVGGRASGLPEIAQVDTAFAPAVLVVPVGTEVAFPNRDEFFHNVFSYSSTERFDLGRYPLGASKSVVFDTPGVVNVYCEVHEFMRSAVLVAENPFFAIVGDDGSFAIQDVPPGNYTVVVWHADLGEVRESVVVQDDAVTRVSVQLGG